MGNTSYDTFHVLRFALLALTPKQSHPCLPESADASFSKLLAPHRRPTALCAGAAHDFPNRLARHVQRGRHENLVGAGLAINETEDIVFGRVVAGHVTGPGDERNAWLHRIHPAESAVLEQFFKIRKRALRDLSLQETIRNTVNGNHHDARRTILFQKVEQGR